MQPTTDVQDNKAFDKALKDHVEKKGKRVLCISIRGDEMVISGEESSVLLAKEKFENLTLAELS